MKMPPPLAENQNSSLLSTEENLQVFRLLGNRCQTIATTVVQIFTTSPPTHSQWVKKDTGVLCFVKDNSRKNYFFRLFNLKRNQMTWEQEMYNNMDYTEAAPFFYTFECEESIVAFNFANQQEAKSFKLAVDQKINARKRKGEKRARQIQQAPIITFPQKNLDFGAKQEFQREKRRRNITKADISTPMDFVHISHVGWDPTTGFDVSIDDSQLKSLFQKAGVSEKQLQDKDTREFIYDFINKHRTLNNDPNPPLVPPRGPPRPPSGNPRIAPPPPPVHRTMSQVENSAPKKARPPSPPKHVGAGNSVAPPPPPPPPMMNNNLPPPPLPMDGLSTLIPSSDENKTEEVILQPIEDRKLSPVDNARGDLLSEIRKGIQLKPVDEREVKSTQDPSPTSTGGNDLARALKQALFERSKVIHSEDDDDDTSSTSNDDEWDD